MDKDGNQRAATSACVRACWPCAWRSPLRIFSAILALWFLSFTAPAQAAADVYRLYIDSDANSASGCAASMADRYGSVTLSGFEYPA